MLLSASETRDFSKIRRDVGIALPNSKETWYIDLWQYSGNAGIATCSKPLDAATCMSQVFTYMQ